MDLAQEPGEEPDMPHLENTDVHVSLQASLLGTDVVPALWAERQRTYDASDLEDFMSLLAQAQAHRGY